jgi:hypothetical protein
MGILKRKRSESEVSFSSGSTFSSPTRPGSSNFNFGGMEAGVNSPIRYGATAPPHLPGRTMKRFRDNRLPEEEIHRKSTHLRSLRRYAAAYRTRREHVEDAILGATAAAAAAPPPPPPRPNATSRADITSNTTAGNALFEILGPKIAPRLLEHPISRHTS